MPDYTKSLGGLRKEWQDCIKCELGTRRQAVEGHFVFGEGAKHGIMFIGEGPGSNEEEQGRPFVGQSGKLLRSVLKQLKLDPEFFYITNLVACRSCSPALDEAGNIRMRNSWVHGKKVPVPIYKDETPIPSQIEACKARLYEEIYLVDPLIIVTLGAAAASFIMQQKVAITTNHGPDSAGLAQIPGAGHVPVVTDKKKAWARIVKGELHMPVEQSHVDYFVIPTLHPAYVLRKLEDRGVNSPFRQFANDIQHAVRLLHRFRQEVFGAEPLVEELPTDFVIDLDAEESEQT